MQETDEPKPQPVEAERAKRVESAEVISLAGRTFPAKQPDDLSAAEAVRIVRMLAADSDNIVVLPHGKKRGRLRRINRRQMELCIQRGTICEGPFLNQFGNWQMNFYRHAAGEEVTCVVAIEWLTSVLVISTF